MFCISVYFVSTLGTRLSSLSGTQGTLFRISANFFVSHLRSMFISHFTHSFLQTDLHFSLLCFVFQSVFHFRQIVSHFSQFCSVFRFSFRFVFRSVFRISAGAFHDEESKIDIFIKRRENNSSRGRGGGGAQQFLYLIPGNFEEKSNWLPLSKNQTGSKTQLEHVEWCVIYLVIIIL